MLRNPLTFPAKPAISPEAQDLITQLLVKDPAQRLGSKAGECWLLLVMPMLRALSTQLLSARALGCSVEKRLSHATTVVLFVSLRRC